jgi:hypothetical protein
MKRESRHDHNPVETKSEEAAAIASMLAPLEEQEGSDVDGGGHQPPNDGAIFFNTAELKLPKHFIEEDKERGFLGLEPIAIVIFLIVLAFIALVAYLISIEPA